MRPLVQDAISSEASLAQLLLWNCTRWRSGSRHWKNREMGDLLMLDALQMVAQASGKIGIMGLHLRSTKHGRKLYESYDFGLFTAHPSYDGNRYLLHIEDIREFMAGF